MIKYQMHSSGMFPRIFCDSCSNPIEDDKGFTLWDDAGNVAHAHMGACAFKLDRGAGFHRSESLITFLANLLHNTHIDPKTLQADTMWHMTGVVQSREELRGGK
jgi:hypothetical protein